MMQVDIVHFPNARISSGKRLRSSVSPSPSERPSKRMSMGPESKVATPSYVQYSLPEDVAMNEDSISTETRGRLEDWVTRTGGLKLDSPSTSILRQLLHSTPLPEGREWDPSKTNTTIFPTNTLSSDPNDHSMSHNALSSFEELVDVHMHMQIESSLSTSGDFVENTSLLWLSTATTTPLPPTPRKSKIKMGRRADCEKCRLGVKGHWMHID